MKDDAVRIALREDEDRSPTMPDWNRFWAIPSESPHLREFITSIVWNAYQKSLVLEVTETAAFSAYDWFSKLPSNWDEPENEQAIAVCFFNGADQEVARLLFTDLHLTNHNCVLSTKDKDISTELIHEITLHYTKVERSKVEEPELGVKIDAEDWVFVDKEMILS